jgi:RNA polymerase sigma-54 factor
MRCEQTVRQDHRLIMSAAMEQAFHVLMMPVEELSEWLISEIEKNPLLKLTKPILEETEISLIPFEKTLYEHLLHQIELSFNDTQEKEIARFLAGSLDEKGFLTLTKEELKGKEEVLKKFQHLDPQGIGARNPREALLIQLRKKEGSLPFTLIAYHYDDLLHNRLGKISKTLKINLSELQQIIRKELRPLNPCPASSYHREVNPYLTADLSINYENEVWSIEITDSYLPKIEIDEVYLHTLQSAHLKKEESEFIRRYLAAASWLERSIDRRSKILYQIGSYLLKTQKRFLEGTDSSPIPMTMKDMANALHLNESTITRAISNKGAATPRGLIPLRKFFTHSVESDQGKISNQEAKILLLRLIDQETDPLSDEALSIKLKAHGIQCARRTVTKYRKELKIGSASQRRLYRR